MANCELNSKSFHTKLSNHKTNIPKAMRAFFLLVQFCFSMDYGFVTYKTSRQKLILKLLALIQCIALIGITLTTIEEKLFFIYLKLGLENFAYCLFFILLNTENSFYQIVKDLLAIDRELGVDYHKEKIHVIIIIILIVSNIYRYIFMILQCHVLQDCSFDINVPQLFMHIPMLSLSLPYIVTFSAYYSVYSRLKMFNEFVRNSEVDIVTCQYLYKRLIEIAEKCKITSDFTIGLALLCDTPQIMFVIYFILKDYNIQMTSLLIMNYGNILYSAITLFSPAYAADGLASEAEKLIVVLHDKIIARQSHHKHEKVDDIKRFIRYVEARPFKIKVCKVLPMDANLPVIVLNVCVTYLIVVIQFTHLY